MGCDNERQLRAIADTHFGKTHGINQNIKATGDDSDDPDQTDPEESDENSFGELDMGSETDADDKDEDETESEEEGQPQHAPASSKIKNDPADIAKALVTYDFCSPKPGLRRVYFFLGGAA